jgi:hypothetical protein
MDQSILDAADAHVAERLRKVLDSLGSIPIPDDKLTAIVYWGGRGVGPHALARKWGISYPTIRRWRLAHHLPDLSHLLRWVRVGSVVARKELGMDMASSLRASGWLLPDGFYSARVRSTAIERRWFIAVDKS